MSSLRGRVMGILRKIKRVPRTLAHEHGNDGAGKEGQRGNRPDRPCHSENVTFYVDNGKQLPIWKDLPHFTYWLFPAAAGVPLIIRTLLWHPLVSQPRVP